MTTIVTGDPTFIVDGQPLARHGDLCACGAKLLSSQMAAWVEEGNGSSGPSGTDKSPSGRSAVEPLPLMHDEQVQLLTDTAFAPGLPFYIKAGTQVIAGRVGADRRLPRIETPSDEQYRVWIGDGALAMAGVINEGWRRRSGHPNQYREGLRLHS